MSGCSSGVNEGGGSSLSGAGSQGTQGTDGGGTDTEGATSAGPGSETDTSASSTSGPSTSATTNNTTEPDPSSTLDPSSTSDDPTIDPTGTTGELDCNSVNTTCAESTNLGPVGPGESASSLPLQLDPEHEHWYTIQFTLTGGQRPGTGTPTIVFDQNTNEAFGFDVIFDACGNQPVNCLEEGSSATGIQQWEFMDIPTDGLTMMPGYNPPDMQTDPWPENAFVRVYRVDDAQTCETYQLSAKRP